MRGVGVYVRDKDGAMNDKAIHSLFMRQRTIQINRTVRRQTTTAVAIIKRNNLPIHHDTYQLKVPSEYLILHKFPLNLQ
jgi:hypothetical protein